MTTKLSKALKTGLITEYTLAKAFGISRGRIERWVRNEKEVPTEFVEIFEQVNNIASDTFPNIVKFRDSIEKAGLG